VEERESLEMKLVMELARQAVERIEKGDRRARRLETAVIGLSGALVIALLCLLEVAL